MNLYLTFTTQGVSGSARVLTTDAKVYDRVGTEWEREVESTGWQRISGTISGSLRQTLLDRLPDTVRDMDGYRWVLIDRNGTVVLIELLTDDAHRVKPTREFSTLGILDGFLRGY